MQVVLDKPQYQQSFMGYDGHIKYRITTHTNISRYCASARAPIEKGSGAIFTVYRRMRCACVQAGLGAWGRGGKKAAPIPAAARCAPRLAASMVCARSQSAMGRSAPHCPGVLY